jgi:hypothetical protein
MVDEANALVVRWSEQLTELGEASGGDANEFEAGSAS